MYINQVTKSEHNIKVELELQKGKLHNLSCTKGKFQVLIIKILNKLKYNISIKLRQIAQEN